MGIHLLNRYRGTSIGGSNPLRQICKSFQQNTFSKCQVFFHCSNHFFLADFALASRRGNRIVRGHAIHDHSRFLAARMLNNSLSAVSWLSSQNMTPPRWCA
jgi:hypothetical protein